MSRETHEEKVIHTEDVLLEELWQGPHGEQYRLIIGKPIPLRDTDHQCLFYVEGLYAAPKYHPQVSPALAVRDAIRVAARDLEEIGASPLSVPK